MKRASAIFSSLICLLCGVNIGICLGRDWHHVIFLCVISIVAIVGNIIIQCTDDSDSEGEEKI